jgi:DNA-binding NarL/FixJ family response regulator
MEAARNILIVDDDAEFANMVAQAVSDMSSTYTVTVTTDAQTAMTQVEQAHASLHPVDLVITDVSMPGSSGLRLIESLNQAAPQTQAIAMTEFHSPDLAARVQEFRVHTYVVKPITPSEIRRIVREALAGPAEEHTPQPPGELPDRQKVVIERQLASLRRRTGSTAALLIHISGTRLAADRIDADLDVGGLCQTLMDAQQMVASAMKQALQSDIPVQQSYYGTASYSICTYRLDDSLFVATIFGPKVREGQVWYAMREAATDLQASLAGGASSAPAERSGASDSWRAEIEQYFSDPSAESTPIRRNARDRDTSAAAAPRIEETGPQPQAKNEPQHVHLAPDSTLPTVDQIDWDIPTSGNWDQVVAEYKGTFEGIGFEEAQSRGLYAPEESIEQPTLDDIDWEAGTDRAITDLDWDKMVAEADQGFGGLSLEEAKRRGIIDDLERE